MHCGGCIAASCCMRAVSSSPGPHHYVPKGPCCVLPCAAAAMDSDSVQLIVLLRVCGGWIPPAGFAAGPLLLRCACFDTGSGSRAIAISPTLGFLLPRCDPCSAVTTALFAVCVVLMLQLRFLSSVFFCVCQRLGSHWWRQHWQQHNPPKTQPRIIFYRKSAWLLLYR